MPRKEQVVRDEPSHSLTDRNRISVNPFQEISLHLCNFSLVAFKAVTLIDKLPPISDPHRSARYAFPGRTREWGYFSQPHSCADAIVSIRFVWGYYWGYIETQLVENDGNLGDRGYFSIPFTAPFLNLFQTRWS